MLCERCGQRPATVHYTEIINNQKRTMRLCEVCARELQTEHFGVLPQMNLHKFLAGLLHHELGVPAPAPTHPLATDRCPTCGLSEAQFAKQGLLGCGMCYQHFGERLDPVFRRLHGHTRHIGKVPARTGGRIKVVKEVERLKMQLKEAIRREEFEQAARLRDQIRALEQKLAQEGMNSGD